MSVIKGYLTKLGGPGQGDNVTITHLSGNKVGLDVNVASFTGSISGTFTQSGLQTALKTTCMNVTDIATKLPVTPLANRNALSITNLSGSDTIYVGNSDVIAGDVIGNLSGWPVGPNEGFNLDITDDIEIYGIADAGKTIKIKIIELA